MAQPIPLQKDPSQAERALLGIRDLVLRGEFRTGERLPELALVELLGMSRTPIRAALQKLAEEGLLEATQPTGYTVRGFSETEIADAIEVRGTLEALAARMAAERGVSASYLAAMTDCLDRIEALLAKAKPGRDFLAQYCQFNTRFHELLAEASSSDIVTRALTRAGSCPSPATTPSSRSRGRFPVRWKSSGSPSASIAKSSKPSMRVPARASSPW